MKIRNVKLLFILNVYILRREMAFFSAALASKLKILPFNIRDHTIMTSTKND